MLSSAVTTSAPATEPACPGPTPLDTRTPAATDRRSAPAERRPSRLLPRDLGRARRREPVGDPVLRLGLPAGLVGRIRRERPRGDLVVVRADAPGRDRRDRAAHAPPRGRAGGRARPHDAAPRFDADLTPVPAEATAVFFGASYHADYATILCGPADLPEVADGRRGQYAVARERSATWDVIDLRRLRCGDPAADALAAAFGAREIAAGLDAQRSGRTSARSSPCPTADLDDYLATLDKKERHEIRRKVRRAEAAGEVAPDALGRSARRPRRVHRPPPEALGRRRPLPADAGRRRRAGSSSAPVRAGRRRTAPLRSRS